jgi:hypothetical protein
MAEVLDATKHATIEDVNTKLLDKLEELIDSIDSKSNPELMKVITESVAKLNASLKGNDIFAPKETEEQKREREAQEAILSAYN